MLACVVQLSLRPCFVDVPEVVPSCPRSCSLDVLAKTLSIRYPLNKAISVLKWLLLSLEIVGNGPRV